MSPTAPDPSAQESELLRLRQEVATLKAQLGQQNPPSNLGWDETLCRAVFDQALHLAGILDPAGHLQHANQIACALIGRPLAELVGQPFWATPWWAHSPAEQVKLRDAIAHAARGNRIQFETTHPGPDGSRHAIEFSIRPALDDTGHVLALAVEGWDITKRQQTEEALTRTHLLLDAVLDQSPVPTVVVSSPDQIVRYLNRSALQTLGIADEPSYEGLALPAATRRRTWLDLQVDDTPFPPEALPLARALCGEPTRNIEHIIVRKDGTRSWVLATGTPIANRDGSLMAGVVAFRDITEQKQAQERNRQMANEQRTILNTVTTGLCLLKDRRVQWFNPAFAEMFGYATDELTGVEMRQFYADSGGFDRVGCEGYARLAQGEGYSAEVLYQRRDGTPFWCNISGRAIDPRHLEEGSIWELHDITDRKQAEELTHETEKRFQRLVENSNDIIAVIDARGAYLSLSGPLKAILGYTPEELLGRNGFELLHPEDTESTTRALGRALAQPGVTHRVENRYRHKLGHWVALEAVGTSWLHDPAIRGVVLNIREITERKNAERERAALQEQLQQAMKMEAVGRLAGGVAHDFNNLLTVITGNVELAAFDLAPSDPIAQYLAEVGKAAESAAALTRQLLAFSRRQLIEPKILSLSELVDNLRKMLHRLIGEDIELRTALATELGSVKADPGQFDQVVVNLVVNARDAMPDGGRLTITTANVELDAAYCQRQPDMKPGSYVLLAVSDTGQGMPPEVKRRLFEPFFTTKPKGRGTGLGLAVIFGVVKQAGGFIEVDSEPGRGTTFKIYLPRLEEPAEKLARTSASPDLPRGDETVLLVEDETSVRELATAILQRLGYHVLAAAHGAEACRLAEHHPEPIHLLLTDVVMPGMNGRELSERLLRIRPGLAVLFASGYTDDMIVHHGVLGEHLHFIAKPYTLQAIARKVRQVLDAKPVAIPATTAPAG